MDQKLPVGAKAPKKTSPKIPVKPFKFTDRMRKRYLTHLEATGRKADSAKIAGVSSSSILQWRKMDADFDEQCELALEQYADIIRGEVYRRGVPGWEEDVYYRGEVVGKVRRFSDRMLELEAKRVDPGYRDKQQLDVNVQAGLFVIPGSTQNPAPEPIEGLVLPEKPDETTP